jgi:molecular chaperone GrpE
MTPSPDPSSSPDAAPAEASPEAARLAALEAEVGQLKDALLRATADQQNQARRHQRDQADLRRFAAAAVLEDLLPALDSLRLGLASADGQPGAAVAAGFTLAIQQLEAALASHGLKEIPALGQPFDPSRHEALSQEASADKPEGTVLRVLRTGWILHDRLLRPAGVVVTAPPAA